MKIQQLGFALLVLLWLGVFAYLIVPKEMQLYGNFPHIILPAEPVDPRDLLQGDYVVLTYPFSDLNCSETECDFAETPIQNSLRKILAEAQIKDEIFVIFAETENKRVRVTDFTTTKPSANELFLRGKIKNLAAHQLSLDFGLSKYFVPEGQGRDLELARNQNNLEVEVALHPQSGQGLIVGILVNGQTYEFPQPE